MATVQDLVNGALNSLGVTQAGEVPAYDDSADALTALNQLVDQWAAERLQIYSIVRTTWTIVSGTGTYTVGTGGTVNVARPVYLDHVNFIDTAPAPDVEYQLEPLTDDGYAALAIKPLTATIPASWYYNPTFPLGTLTFYPVPTSSTLLGALYAPQAVARFAALTTTVALPPGYERMMQTNLALELAPHYGTEPPPSLIRAAEESKAVVKRSNTRLSDLSFPAAALIGSGSRWDIRTGT